MTTEHGKKIVLRFPRAEHLNKIHSEFIYDDALGMWCKLPDYQKLDLSKDDLSQLPTIMNSDLDCFGIWREIKQ